MHEVRKEDSNHHPWVIPALLASALSVIIGSLPQSGSAAGSDGQAPKEGIVRSLELHKYQDAIGQARLHLSENPDDLNRQALLGIALLRGGYVNAAEQLLSKVFKASPEHANANLGVGKILYCKNKLSEAIPHLRAGLSSSEFFEYAFLELWRTMFESSDLAGLKKLHNTVKKRCEDEDIPFPAWFDRSFEFIRKTGSERAFSFEDKFSGVSLPLSTHKRGSIRMVPIEIGYKGPYMFDIDTASRLCLTISPLLAEELELMGTDGARSTGVGSNSLKSSRAWIEEITIGGTKIRNVPALILNSRTFTGEKKGLIGTGFLKHFNCTIDVKEEKLHLYPLDAPELIERNIGEGKTTFSVPFYVYNATVISARVATGPQGLFILDTAASGHLLDRPYYDEFIKKPGKANEIENYKISGAGGTQAVTHIPSLSLMIGDGVPPVPDQAFNIYDMSQLNRIAQRYTTGLIGNPILWPYRIHFDFHSCRLILETTGSVYSQPPAATKPPQ